jgi:hypothetical protein
VKAKQEAYIESLEACKHEYLLEADIELLDLESLLSEYRIVA